MVKISNKVKKYKFLLGTVFLLENISLVGCQNIGSNLGEVINEGYVFNENDLLTVNRGSSEKQILLALGTPTLETNLRGKIYYYISQKRYRPAQFMPAKIVDRKIFALYFDKNNKVAKVANYGLKDGLVFDFLSQTTPSVYQEDKNVINQLLQTTKLMPAGLPTNSH